MATAAEKVLKNKRLYLRVNPHQREMIDEAAEVSQKDVSAFVLEAALVTAERILADRRVFPLNQQEWDDFHRALERPVTRLAEKPRLEKLLSEPSALEQ